MIPADKRRALWELCAYPGTILFALFWVAEHRRLDKRPLVDRLLSAQHEALDAL